jgi:type II secretory ATPase GspE/PulE/Tfp pilus assembly ATPase PilB-like protein
MTTNQTASSGKTSPFEQFCIRRSLILLEGLNAWRKEAPETAFEGLLVRHHQAINEERWMEAIAYHGGLSTVLPFTESAAICETALSREAEGLRRNHHAIILQDSPTIVIGVVNPFEKAEPASWMARHHPGRPFAVVSVTPHAFARLSALAERGVASTNQNWSEEDFDEWMDALEFEKASFTNLQALVEDLWTSSPAYPVLPPHQYTGASAIEGEPFALLIRKTATHAWIASPRATSVQLQDSLYQRMGRKIVMLAIGPKEFRRIQLEHAKPQTGVRIESQMPLVVKKWEIENGPNYEIALFDQMVETAIRMGASDIHMDPKPDRTRVRFRIDNDLIEQAPVSKNDYALLARRVKVLGGGMRPDQTGKLQDGAGHIAIAGMRYDMRFSILVLRGGDESLVIRLFSATIPKLEDLRLPEREMSTLLWFLDQESGMLTSTGPTGSGKTTTLYACLRALSSSKTSLVTIENPVEKHFEPAKQVDVGGDHGISYPDALRAVLRQDPDVIMVGEIRDHDSAHIAVQSALTGHQVLTTVHASDAVGVIERLCGSFDIDRIALAYALKLSVAQRLIKKLCPHCRRTRAARPEELRAFPEVNIPNPEISDRVGCPACRGTGYSGRVLIMEMLPFDSEIVTLIERRAAPREIREHNANRGYTNLLTQATQLLLTGEIELAEARSFLTTKPVW